MASPNAEADFGARTEKNGQMRSRLFVMHRTVRDSSRGTGSHGPIRRGAYKSSTAFIPYVDP